MPPPAWPTAIMAQGFMAKGLHGMPYDPFAIAAADHWHSVGVQRVRALSNDVANSAFRPGWLALGRARLDQLGGRELHGRGGPCGGRRSCRLPRPPVGWRGRQRLVRPRTPSVERSAKRRSSNVRRRRQAGLADMPKDTGLGIANHIWTGTRYADLDRLRRARAGPTAAAVR
jgi:isoquinoline 1-oxidoreductase subunit beta